VSKIAIERTLPEQAWRMFVDGNAAGNIFHGPEMFRVFSHAKDHRPELWAATKNKSVLALLSPVRIALKGGLLRYLTSRAIGYGGALWAPGAEGLDALEKLLCTYVREAPGGLLFTELRNRTDVATVRPILEKCRFSMEGEYNFLVDLSLPIERIWGNISRSTQKKIRRAQHQEGVTIEQLEEKKNLSTWYALVQQTFRRVQVPLADYSLFESAFDYLYPLGKIQFLLARVRDRYIGASAVLLHKAVVYDWYRGFDWEYGDCHPNDAMVWSVLSWGAENGYRVFDFGGAGKPEEDYGPRTFKSRFGGSLVDYGRCRYVHSRLRYGLSKTGYGALKKLL